MKRYIGPYKVMLHTVASEIGRADFDDLKGLSSLDAITTPMELFTALEQRRQLNASNVRILLELLHQVDNEKLAKIVSDYENKYLHHITDDFFDGTDPYRRHIEQMSVVCESRSIGNQATACRWCRDFTEDRLEYTIHCMKCERLLCKATDLRQRGMNVVVVCPEYEDKLIVKKKCKPNWNTLHKIHIGYTLCKNCQKQLGPEFVYHHGSPRDFGLSQGAVKWKLSTSDKYHLVENWKHVPFFIMKQNIDELID